MYGVIEREFAVIIVAEAIGSPIIVKPQPVLAGRRKRIFRRVKVAQLVGIKMPFTDVSRAVSPLGQHMANALLVRIKANFVDHHAVFCTVSAREEAGAERSADRIRGNRLTEVNALPGERIKIWHHMAAAAGIIGNIITHLVGKHKKQIWP